MARKGLFGGSSFFRLGGLLLLVVSLAGGVVFLKSNSFGGGAGARRRFNAQVPIAVRNTVRLEPSAGAVKVGETTTMTVRIENVNNLWGAQTYMSYDPKVVEVDKLEDGGFLTPDFGTKKSGNGQITYIYSQNGQLRQPVNGSGDWFKITFRGVGAGQSAVKFLSTTKLVDRDGYPVGTLVTQDGSISVSSSQSGGGNPVSSGVSVRLEPSAGTVNVGETATMTVRIENVNNLWGAQTYMSYDPKVVEVDKLEDGGFLVPDFGISNFGKGQITYIYAQNGQLRQPVNGSGDWFKITFRGVGSGQSAIKFGSTTKLVDRDGYSVGTLVTQDGTINVSSSPSGNGGVVNGNGVSVRLDPSPGTVSVGQITTMTVRIENVRNLAGAEVHLTYDPSLVQVQKVDAGWFPSPDFVAQSNTAGGKVDYAIAQMPPHKAVSGSGVLVKMTIVGRSAGTSGLNFTSVVLADAEGNQIKAVSQNGTVTVK